MFRLVVAVQAVLVSAGSRFAPARPRRGDRGQATAEYALVLLGVAAVALLVVALGDQVRQDRSAVRRGHRQAHLPGPMTEPAGRANHAHGFSRPAGADVATVPSIRFAAGSSAVRCPGRPRLSWRCSCRSCSCSCWPCCSSVCGARPGPRRRTPRARVLERPPSTAARVRRWPPRAKRPAQPGPVAGAGRTARAGRVEVKVDVRYRSVTDAALIGPLVGDVELRADATMRVER